MKKEVFEFDNLQELQDLYDNEGIKNLAKRLSMSVPTASKKLKDLGIKMKGRGAIRKEIKIKNLQ
jgi:hypothetical protein